MKELFFFESSRLVKAIVKPPMVSTSCQFSNTKIAQVAFVKLVKIHWTHSSLEWNHAVKGSHTHLPTAQYLQLLFSFRGVSFNEAVLFGSAKHKSPSYEKKHTLFLKGMFKRLIRFTRRWCPRRRPGLSTWSHSLLLRTSPQCCCQGATWKKNQRGRVFFSSRQILFWGRFLFLEEAFFLKTLYALQDMNCNVFVAILFGMTLSNNSCFLETGSFKTSADVD